MFQVWDEYLAPADAEALQTCILSLPDTLWDQYKNLLESKYTLRNKFSWPLVLEKFFASLITPAQLQIWERWAYEKTGRVYELLPDPHRHYYGVHKFVMGDFLDLHVDAGLHPLTTPTLRKYLTFGLYLTARDYTADLGGQLEFWSGTSAARAAAGVAPLAVSRLTSIDPLFNRAVAFINTDTSWHGAPQVYTGTKPRLFLTLSYLIREVDAFPHVNTRALFVGCEGKVQDEAKDEVRRKRCQETLCSTVYRA